MPHEDDDALDKIVSDEELEKDETTPEDARLRGGLEEQDDAGIPRPSDDGDPDMDADEREAVGDDGHDTR